MWVETANFVEQMLFLKMFWGVIRNAQQPFYLQGSGLAHYGTPISVWGQSHIFMEINREHCLVFIQLRSSGCGGTESIFIHLFIFLYLLSLSLLWSLYLLLLLTLCLTGQKILTKCYLWTLLSNGMENNKWSYKATKVKN